jgi:hypothetical protein
MTLQEFFNLLAANPTIIIFFFSAVPLTALLACVFSKEEGHLSPWKELYSILLYLASVPGIFAVMLTVYFFLFERRSIMETDVYTQILPVISMFLTIYVIKRHVDLDLIPGFDKLTNLFWMITAILMLLWLVDRTHIIGIIFLPFHIVFLLVVLLLVVVRVGWTRIFG